MIDLRYALVVGRTSEFVIATGRAGRSGCTVLLVAVVGTVPLAVAAPKLAHALLVVASKLVGLAPVRT